MQYELRTQVIEQVRPTFDNLVARNGAKPATRYEEGTIDLEPKENFHYRPLWAPEHEIYGASFSALRLTDPYSFLDPRQFYYAPYVTSRAGMADAAAATLDYLEKRDLLARLPEAWNTLLAEVLVPLRHYESGAQMISSDITRFGQGTSVTQCAAFAAFDRIGNAQLLSRVGIALGGGTAELLGEAKTAWLTSPALQGLRRYIEETLVERDWGVALVRLDVLDTLLFGVVASHLDDAAIGAGAGSYSLLVQHLAAWFAEQRRWVNALYAAWRSDPELGDANAAVLAQAASDALDAATEAMAPFAARVDELTGAGAAEAVAAAAATLRADLAPAG